MDRNRHRRLRATALAGVVALAVLSLAACKEDPDSVATAGSTADPGAAASASAGSGQDADNSHPEDANGDDSASDGASDGSGTTDGSDAPDGDPADGDSDAASPDTSYAVDPPGPFTGLSRADVLVTATKPLPDGVLDRIAGVAGVQNVLPLSVGSVSTNGRTLTVAAVDAGKFRAFTPDVTARADFVWDRVAGGELAVDTDVSKRLIDKDDTIQLGSDEDSPVVHVGAIAPLIHASPNTPAEHTVIQVVMNAKRGEQLGIQQQNALLIDTGAYTPSILEKPFERILGDRATMSTLALEFDNTGQAAVLTGESVSQAVGTFTYTSNPDGTINPDPGWIKEYIRTEQVPILGSVTCNKGMLPQLRGALTEIQQLGLADKIHPGEYAGCYYPRYINHDPSYGLSLHSWGIAVDLNTPGNQRGTVGEMDRGVVAIFKKWGFAWGGDWHYTDPMHFEMSSVVRPDGG